MLSYFRGSFLSIIIGLPICALIGYAYEPSWAGVIKALFIASILTILEVSLSFDNAIVNAVILKEMTPKWRHRFLTWGILIAVFGMRLVFPLAIVAIVAWVNPWTALVLAATDPAEYARIMTSAHTNVAAFGGSFLLMVALKYFYDKNKQEHWIPLLERPAAFAGRMEAIEMAIALVFISILAQYVPSEKQFSFLLCGLAGVVTYVLVHGIETVLEEIGARTADIHKASAGMFLYLEVLDASFSFDGVIGAFAITSNLFIIMIGLGIGAMFVRSLTIYFVEQETLQKFSYLEHGAFYAIGALSLLMLISPLVHIPEWITGLIGAAFIIAAFVSSLRVRGAESHHQ